MTDPTDPTDEPDLLTALALSLDRARARRAQAQSAQGSPVAPTEGDPASAPAPIAPAPSQAVAKRAATLAANRRRTGFRVGDRVTALPRYYAGRTGRVVTTSLGEVGVAFGKADQVDAWFNPEELEKSG